MADNNDQKKDFTVEELRKVAPGYKGKPENFDPYRFAESKGKAKPVRKPKAKKTEKLEELPSPTNLSEKAVLKKNDSLITNAIFGIGIGVTEIAPNQSFAANYRKTIDIASEMYNFYQMDEVQIDRIIAREEIAYYATALLHCRLIEIKARQRLVALTSPEKEIREAIKDYEFNIPHPLAAYLSSIGSYRSKMGKWTYIEIPSLPTTVVQGFGGYHASEVNQDTHNLFEEVPSLGIAGDMLMALASEDVEPTPNFHIAKPPGSEFTTSLVGKFDPIGPRSPEIRQRLEGQGITPTSFAEYFPGTRFNLKYIHQISDIIGNLEIFQNYKVVLKNLEFMGEESQIICTRPSEPSDKQNWNERYVQATSVANLPVAHMGAAYVFGFQLFKEDGPGDSRMEKVANWSCITGVTEQPWVMPDVWYNNRNDRRNLPDGIRTEQFRAISMCQDIKLKNATRRMIKTKR